MSDNAPVVSWDREITPHVVEARDRLSGIALSNKTCAFVRVLNPAREVAWVTDAWAKQKIKPVIHYQAVAMLLQEPGNELEDKNCCSVCANGGTFLTCVVTPILSRPLLMAALLGLLLLGPTGASALFEKLSRQQGDGIDNRTLGFFGGACSNCIWVKKAGTCRHAVHFKKMYLSGTFLSKFPLDLGIGCRSHHEIGQSDG
ncbi:hypothetical protein BDV30DRAFT_243518 [Aspergillus minisclerotigenes]|uniref:Uncharacterized protein n=1 Tax=Aspergillus minisclerotigenes TaxID=656917 RepID=A0A5N6IP54_9EURO|nr:hypothetical protein BDV30DRAFT_243518 [Aspergillus minisclerotigenes]